MIPNLLRKLLLFFLLLSLPGKQVFAWGRTGHSIVAEIACQLLDNHLRAKVDSLLMGLSPAEAANWMDEMRSNPSFQYMAPWHYINIEKNASYDPASTNNIIWELNRVINTLSHKQNLSPDTVKTDLCILFHLAGDLHQPLHVGYGADKGGNTIPVWFAGIQTNLHKVWDQMIIESQHITLKDCMRFYQPELQDQPVNIVAWMQESRALLDGVYAFKNSVIDEAYLKKNTPVIEKQLLEAGVRLSILLKKIFAANPSLLAEKIPASSALLLSITPGSAAEHIGEKVKVCGRVYSSKYLKNSSSRPTFLDMGAPYPDQPLTVFIPGEARKRFPGAPEKIYAGADICITGTVLLYQGKPEIILEDPDQVTLPRNEKSIHP